MRSKLLSLDEVFEEFLTDGMDVALGGALTYNTPSVIAREIINRDIGGLTLYSFMGTYPVDLLAGAGKLSKVMAPFITFAEMGLAPSFRRKVEEGSLEVVEIDEVFWGFGLKAGAASLPFIPLAHGYDNDLPRVNPLYKKVTSPYDGKTYITIPPIKPSLSIIHVQYADEYGNGIHLGNVATDMMLAKASHKVILTCDKLISHEEIRKRNKEVSIPGFLVEGVIEIDFACHPLGSDGLYMRDEEHLRMYAKMARSEDGFNEYLKNYVLGKTHREYLDKIGREKLDNLRIG